MVGGAGGAGILDFHCCPQSTIRLSFSLIQPPSLTTTTIHHPPPTIDHPQGSLFSLCSTTSRDWFALWFNLEPMITPGRFECWKNNARVEWDQATDKPRMPRGEGGEWRVEGGG